MEFGLGAYGFGFLAGLLSTLSPCVLPLVPILLGSATSVHPRAPLALAGGLAISYATIGTALAWAGSALNIDAGVFRYAGAAVLGVLGMVLMSTSLQQRFAAATSGLGDAGNSLMSRVQPDGLWGQFVIGLVLGVVWSPCVGPTLGAAVVLAGQGSHLAQAASLMGVFGIGAALPVVALAYVSRGTIAKARGQLMLAGKTGKMLMGVILVVIAGLILSGADKSIEAWLVSHSPTWLTALTTRY
ncbi:MULTISPECIES: cytochrome c biogenesis CcdA family protein [Ralstonia]|jgi:cytochrome c biogenesis protein CcdA|uniref:Cytochrome c biogenesis protein n=1 Tax=Ralstonia pickettii OR214 TaxID=1264675 RepID=R0DN03_RALPI|nr:MULTISPECIES: cytochrome c biogenesis CcdA family protein [Ralstonia]ENZ74988.1 cytochrome c biogenesis protein [Ralstonia pickettii OR214]MBL4779249.1 cytochrome c biogenesis protein CcdA [Ralstonia sp.]MCM3579385.1 cytochrome c biogenesis CcdA family protein [Ralstonia pickettii]MDR9384178.1 cytochrome c biogenesis CcdA family protein [Ralstonia sp. 11b]OYU23880.1 MAG: cytochrome C biogenesis protein CcdA [Ralstonia sp. PBBBR1]